MTIEELLNSYDPKDLEFQRRFHKEICSRRNPGLSFIPTPKEVEAILLKPLRKIFDGLDAEEQPKEKRDR